MVFFYAVGAAVARKVAPHGAILILSARRVDRLEELAKQCRELGALRVTVMKLDQLDFDSHEKYVESVVTVCGGHVDYLILNAGRSQRKVCESCTLEDDRELMELNVFGTLSLARAFMPHMVSRPAGKGLEPSKGPRSMIAVTSSVAGLVPNPTAATYSMSKSALHGFFNTLRAESSYRGLDVSLICPGPFESEIVEHALGGGKDMAEADKSKRLTAQRCAQLFLRAMHHRLAEIWLAPQPILLFVYLSHFLPPNIVAHIAATLIGPKRTELLAGSGKVDYSSVEQVSVLHTIAVALGLAKPK